VDEEDDEWLADDLALSDIGESLLAWNDNVNV